VLDEVLRLAALAGTEMHVVPDPAAARPYWTEAPLVLVTSDLAPECARARLPRRRDVALVPVSPVTGEPSQAIWELATEIAADQVLVLPDAESWLVRRLTESAAGTARAKVVAMVPGSGGAGASVLAAALAVTAVRHGVRPLLVDADPLGGGLDVLLGWEEQAGLRWPDLAEASGAMSVDGLYSALPRSGNLVVLSWDRSDASAVPESAVAAVIDAGRRGSDLVVVDLPHRLDDAAVRALQAADLALLVVRPDIRGCAAAARMSALIRPHCAAVEAVVRGPAPGNLRASDVSANLRLPLAASLRPESGLPTALDRGEAPAASGKGPLATLCRRLLTRLEAVGEERRP
jgi:secretion/DNA translocation related CpaE-like protein